MPRQDLIQVRRGTAAEWTSANPTLASGEIGFETDTKKMKTGDGSTTWTSLSYIAGADSDGQRQRAVISIAAANEPPPSNNDGDRYIIDFTVGTKHPSWGDCEKGEIVQNVEGVTWDCVTPEEGMVAYVDSENKDAIYVDDGTPAWELRPASNNTPASKTGTTLVFTEDAFYNATTYLTSGDITIDGTDAVIGATIQQHCANYVPNILTAGSEQWRLMDNGIALPDFINVYQITYDGNIFKVWITKIARLNTPVMTITAGSNENIISDWEVPNATNYVIKFNTVDNEGTATQIYSGDGIDLTPDFEFKHTGLTNGTLYYYYITAEGDGFEDSLTGTGSATPLAGFTAYFASPTNEVDFSQILQPTGTYNFTFYVDDVEGDTITSYNQAETLLDLGDTSQHKVELRGTVVGFKIGNTTEESKIYDVEKWGAMKWGVGDGSLNGFFQDCDNLSVSATDTPDINTTVLTNAFSQIGSTFNIDLTGCDFSGLTTVQGAFLDSQNINPDIEGLDFSNISNFLKFLQNTDAWSGEMLNADMSSAGNCEAMFRLSSGANPAVDTWVNFAPTSIKQMLNGSGFTSKSLANWDITNLTDATNFLNGKSLDTADYDATLISWGNQTPLPTGITIHMGNSNYTLGGAAEAARDLLIAASWTITDSGGV